MHDLRRTPLYDVHIAAGAEMVDFGGWEMPMQYPGGILAEHLYTRRSCSLFDVSHMGRLLVEGADSVRFLQRTLSSNVQALEINRAQYCILPDEGGGGVDDAYLCRFEENRFLLVVNAANTGKDLAHLRRYLDGYDCTVTDISADWAAIAVQGSRSGELLSALAGCDTLVKLAKNGLATLSLEGHKVCIARTGYTGEPLGYEAYIRAGEAAWLWNRLTELGAKPAGLGARDTLRLEAGFPLYGHEMGIDPAGMPMPVFAVPAARFAVNFSEQKGDFIGRGPLERQSDAYKKIIDQDFSSIAVLPRRIRTITLLDRGVIRAGMPVFRGDEQIGWVTSGTMVPYYLSEGEGAETKFSDTTAKRAIGLCYIASDVLQGDVVEVDGRGRHLRAAIPSRHIRADTPPFVQPVIYKADAE